MSSSDFSSLFKRFFKHTVVSGTARGGVERQRQAQVLLCGLLGGYWLWELKESIGNCRHLVFSL